MKYIFLAAGIWNLLGAVNFIFLPTYQAERYGYPLGNMWETHFIGGIAVIFSIIYFSFFKREPEKDMLYLVYLFALGKIWVFISTFISYKYYNMPFKFMTILGGGDLIIGLLFIFYIFQYKKRIETQ